MSFSQALSGLNAQREKLGAIGNNIANSQTVGFKSSNVQFADVFAESRIGLGVRTSAVLQDFTQGNVESSSRNMDLAISGEGFFRFQQPNGEVGYSRNGQLTMTADGRLVNAQGAQIMGYAADAEGNVQAGGAVQALAVDAGNLAANATTSASTSLNLDSRVQAGTGLQQVQVTTDLMNPDNPTSQEDLSYNFSSNFTVYDSLGNPRNMTVYYEKRPEAENSWLGKVVMDGYYSTNSDPVGLAAGSVVEGVVDAQAVAKQSYDNLLNSMSDIQADLESLQTEIRNAATSASASGATQTEIVEAVNSAAQSFASGAGFSLSEVLDKYLNGQQVTPEENAVYAAYIAEVQGQMDDATDANGVVAATTINPLTETATVEAFSNFMAGRQAALIEEAPAEFAAAARSATNLIVDAATGTDIAAQNNAAQGTDLEIDPATITAIQAISNNLSQQALTGVTDPAVASAVNNVTAAVATATGSISAVVQAAQAADPGEAFEAYGVNDFVIEFNQNGTLKRVGQPQLANGGGVEYVDVTNNRPSINYASDSSTPLGGATEALSFDINLAGSTQFGNASVANDVSQDGYASGSLVGVTIQDDGTIMRNYSNEQSLAAGQIALVSFRNPEGLSPEGDNLWTATASSGEELVGAAGTGLRGMIQASATETSNVDMAQELVSMIVAQRAYQANSQTISTQDELLQTIINL
ncbi:flagellar hook-basal body complex protein [Halomonas hibernica]|uniref:flagellar hook-basal body complex protein n=1 Tax=Halomonas hibernica TaxID=2591147 RepID=UPI0015527FE5|nr:flagellar hook-basal body complex protein [Halomonas hibernica]